MTAEQRKNELAENLHEQIVELAHHFADIRDRLLLVANRVANLGETAGGGPLTAARVVSQALFEIERQRPGLPALVRAAADYDQYANGLVEGSDDEDRG